MNLAKSNRAAISVSLLIGFIVGAALTLPISFVAYKNYQRSLDDDYVGSRMIQIVISQRAIAKAENNDKEGIISDQRTMMRGSFLTLVDLHKSGAVKPIQKAMAVKRLKEAKAFMGDRPDQFLNFGITPMNAVLNSQLSEERLSSSKIVDEHLNAAFKYVDKL